jgi:predicted phage gp36 major capsid-like protein
LRLASRKRCRGIKTILQEKFSDLAKGSWVFKAVVYKNGHSSGFVGYGDAAPSNTSPLVRGAEMRVAETRAVNRALRKAYGIGLCSVEELGSFSASQKPLAAIPHPNGHHGSNGSSDGQPRLRDQLCLLIRQHNLDPALVKAYATDFCGTATLKEASRDLVESFISELSRAAKNNRDSLLCKLNSYAQPTEVKL